MIAPTDDAFRMWDVVLRKLHAIRQVLMSGLGHLEMREKLWENQYWKGADQITDKKLDFTEVERICRRLNNNSSVQALQILFKVSVFSLSLYRRGSNKHCEQKADTRKRGYLDIDDFRQFVKMLKYRPELERLHKTSSLNGCFDFPAFEKFMRECQRVSSFGNLRSLC